MTAGRKTVKVLLLHVESDVEEFASKALINNQRLRAAITRVYPITCPGNSSLLDAVQEALEQETQLADKTFRLQTYPRSFERKLGDGPDSVCECCSTRPGCRIRLEAKGATHMLSAVLASEKWYVGTADRARYSVCWDHVKDDGSAGDDQEGSSGEVCKAYYKMREALEEAASWHDMLSVQGQGRAWRAMDIGASPGGWTQCLLEMGARLVQRNTKAKLIP